MMEFVLVPEWLIPFGALIVGFIGGYVSGYIGRKVDGRSIELSEPELPLLGPLEGHTHIYPKQPDGLNRGYEWRACRYAHCKAKLETKRGGASA